MNLVANKIHFVIVLFMPKRGGTLVILMYCCIYIHTIHINPLGSRIHALLDLEYTEVNTGYGIKVRGGIVQGSATEVTHPGLQFFQIIACLIPNVFNAPNMLTDFHTYLCKNDSNSKVVTTFLTVVVL